MEIILKGDKDGIETANEIKKVHVVPVLFLSAHSDEPILKRVNEVGEIIRTTLEKWKDKYAIIGDVRGIGAMRLVEFVKNRNSKEADADVTLEVIKDAVSNGLILIRAGLFSNCIRLLPPVVITDEQLIEGLKVLEDAIARAQAKRS